MSSFCLIAYIWIFIDQSVIVKRLLPIFPCNNMMSVGIQRTRVSSAVDHWGVSGAQHLTGLALKLIKITTMNHY